MICQIQNMMNSIWSYFYLKKWFLKKSTFLKNGTVPYFYSFIFFSLFFFFDFYLFFSMSCVINIEHLNFQPWCREMAKIGYARCVIPFNILNKILLNQKNRNDTSRINSHVTTIFNLNIYSKMERIGSSKYTNAVALVVASAVFLMVMIGLGTYLIRKCK